MDEVVASALLERELSAWRQRPYHELFSLLDQPQCSATVGPDGITYQLEIQCFFDDRRSRNIRVMGCIDDGKGWRVLRPLASDFIKSPAGDFVGE
jgi:hypothetical protein